MFYCRGFVYSKFEKFFNQKVWEVNFSIQFSVTDSISAWKIFGDTFYWKIKTWKAWRNRSF